MTSGQPALDNCRERLNGIALHLQLRSMKLRRERDLSWVFAWAAALCKFDLSPGFIDDHRDRIGEIEAAASGHHGHADTLRLRHRAKNLSRQSSGFWAEHKRIALLIVHQVVA